MKKIFNFIAVSLCVISVSSCKGWLDINTDPNSPAEENISNGMIFPGAEMGITASYSNMLHSFAGYHVQYFAQDFGTENYLDFSEFKMSPTRFGSIYQQLYQKCLQNFQTIIVRSAAEEDWGTHLAATTLRVFVYQVLVDACGELPYSEALDPTNVAPKYDEGEAIYAGLIDELNAALSKVSGAETVCTNFLFPDEPAAPWVSFAKALKLKLYMRMGAGEKAAYKADLDALVAEGDFPMADVAYVGCWGESAGQESPFYAEEFSSSGGSNQVNLCANVAIVRTMQERDPSDDTIVIYEDGRLASFFETNASGEFTGSISGTNFSTSTAYKQSYWCRPVASYDMPAYLLTVAEIEFFLAEYEQLYGTAAAAQAHYEAAIEASFESAGAAGAAAAIAHRPYDAANYKKCIGIEKWIALCGVNAFESWCEVRRLGYPAFGTVMGSDMYDEQNDSSYAPQLYEAGTLYTPLHVYNLVGENQMIARYPYAETSYSRNPNAPKFPGYTVPVFWAK